MAKRQVKPTVLAICVAKLGAVHGGLAAGYIACYAMTEARLGHFPTAVEYADDWGVDERTAWRHRKRMTEVFGDEWPEVVKFVAAEVERRSLGVRAATQLPIPRALSLA